MTGRHVSNPLKPRFLFLILRCSIFIYSLKKQREMKTEDVVELQAETGETRRRLNGWTLELANWLMGEEENMSRSEAFRKAHLTRRLLEELGRGAVKFCYVKKDGTVRWALGTLCHGISEAFDGYEYKRSDSVAFERAQERGVYVYFDLEKVGFRAFAASKIVEMRNEKGEMRNVNEK